MNKKFLSLILSMILLFALACPVMATAENVPFNTMVVDAAEILSESEEQWLAQKAWDLTQEYQCAVYITTVPNLGGYEVQEYSQLIFDQWNMGYGSERSSINLLLSMDEREYDIMAHGYGNTAFTDYGKEVMAERFLDEFGNDDWYGGFEEYLDCCGEFLQLAAEGKPYDVNSEEASPLVGLAAGIGVPALIAHIVCSKFESQMKTANKQTKANNYMTAAGLELSKRNDVFTHTTVSERLIETESRSSGGGTTVNSHGSSHKSGKF